jgi:ABC-2 type transport system permease protein
VADPLDALRAPRRPDALRAYARLVGAQVRSQTAYRGSFAIDLGTNAFIPIIELLSVVTMFRVTRTLGGFTMTEVVVMYGLAATGFCLADLAVGNIEKIRVYVREGLLDAVLIRPLGVLGQLVTLDFTLRRIARLFVALAVLSIAVDRAGLHWTVGRAVLLVLTPFGGAVLFGAIFVAGSTVAFWWIESGEVANGFTYGGRDFTSYPITVYSRAFRRIFAYGVGFAFVGYYPALALLGRDDPLGAPGWLRWCAPAMCLAAVPAAGAVWRFGVRHYRSTGS